MNRSRTLALVRDAVAYPAGGVGVAAGLGWAAGVGPGVGVLAASMVSAAALTVAFLRGGGSSPGGAGADERSTGPEVRAALSDATPDPGAERRARLRTMAAGLFVQSALGVLWLGGLIGI